MTPKEKAKELVDSFKGIVYPYIGSSMLTNDADEGVILRNAKICAVIVVDEILSMNMIFDIARKGSLYSEGEFYNHVKEEIEKL
jgi:hypothetical protein